MTSNAVNLFLLLSSSSLAIGSGYSSQRVNVVMRRKVPGKKAKKVVIAQHHNISNSIGQKSAMLQIKCIFKAAKHRWWRKLHSNNYQNVIFIHLEHIDNIVACTPVNNCNNMAWLYTYLYEATPRYTWAKWTNSWGDTVVAHEGERTFAVRSHSAQRTTRIEF